jgi:hypothetical protein
VTAVIAALLGLIFFVASAAGASAGSSIPATAGRMAMPTPRGAGGSCVGDCGGDGQVTLDELPTGVDIALARAPLSACPSIDLDGDQQATVVELVAVINNFLAGCPPPLPSCEETAPSDAEIEQAIADAVDGLGDPWGADFGDFVGRTEIALGCSLRSETPLPVRSGAQAASGDPCYLDYDPGCRYCGPGVNGFFNLRVGDCLNRACFDHDICYDKHCVDVAHKCYFTLPQGAACDPAIDAACSECPSDPFDCCPVRSTVVCLAVKYLLSRTPPAACNDLACPTILIGSASCQDLAADPGCSSACFRFFLSGSVSGPVGTYFDPFGTGDLVFTHEVSHSCPEWTVPGNRPDTCLREVSTQPASTSWTVEYIVDVGDNPAFAGALVARPYACVGDSTCLGGNEITDATTTIVCSPCVDSPNVCIDGRVVCSNATDQGVPGAVVSTSLDPRTTTTDAIGHFLLDTDTPNSQWASEPYFIFIDGHGDVPYVYGGHPIGILFPVSDVPACP